MQKNLYYREVLRRKNPLKELLIRVFMGFSSWPRLLLEVFIRKNFGERYFSFSTAVVMTCFLALLPFAFFFTGGLFSGGYGRNWTLFFFSYTSWYLFLAAFMFMAVLRRREIKRNPSVFDFAKFSLYAGDIDQRFFGFTILGTPDIRRVEILLEPALFLVGGFALSLFGQSVGMLIMFCSILYSLSYVAAYHIGDEYVMDKIDEKICNEDFMTHFISDSDTSYRGLRCYSRKPVSEENRQKIAEDFIEDDEEVFMAQ
jgi:hypothetical protein